MIVLILNKLKINELNYIIWFKKKQDGKTKTKTELTKSKPIQQDQDQDCHGLCLDFALCITIKILINEVWIGDYNKKSSCLRFFFLNYVTSRYLYIHTFAVVKSASNILEPSITTGIPRARLCLVIICLTYSMEGNIKYLSGVNNKYLIPWEV